MRKGYLLNIIKIIIAVLLINGAKNLKLGHQLETHYQQAVNTEQQQLNYLISLQNNLAQGTNTLKSQADSIQSRLSATSNVDQRILILQNAINAERLKIGDLSTKVIPDPNSGLYQCEMLNLDQQKNWGSKASQISLNINQIQQLTSAIPECDQITGIKQQIRKAKINLNRVQNLITTQCEKNLEQGSAVYQTNLYQNNKWLLGTMSMDQLIQDYYQRSIRYGNITNCPLNRPFLVSALPTSSVSSCVACSDPNRPYFDLSTKSCVGCSADQSYDINSRQCRFLPKNSNYEVGTNYRLKPLNELPKPDPNLQFCPQNSPFYNTEKCIQCPPPNNYWQVSQSKCYTCPPGSIFNFNLRQCIIPQKNRLTILDGTYWVVNDGNIARVYEQRQRILVQNQTSKAYTLCPNDFPYFQGQVCIKCQNGLYFSLDQLKCIPPPKDTVYSKNLHRFVVPEANRETDPRAPNYISSQTLTDDPNIPNCNSSFPYYDLISCINCQKPLPIFNYDTKQCINCDLKSYYDAASRKCAPKTPLYVQGNLNGLMATQKVSFEGYNNYLKSQLAKNPLSYAEKCPEPNQYAALTKCVSCQPNSYFNIQTFNCVVCDGTIDPQTRKCIEKRYFLINPLARNVIVPQGTTFQDIKANNNKLIQSNPAKYSICNQTHPYPYQGKSICGQCPEAQPLYNAQAQACTYCQYNKVYDQSKKKCIIATLLTNYNKNILLVQPLTMKGLLDAQLQTNKTTLTKKCPQSSPFTSDGLTCFNCQSVLPYFDIKNKKCVGCPFQTQYSNETNQCIAFQYLTNLEAPNLIESENFTVSNIKIEQQKLIANKNIKTIQCPIDSPYAMATACTKCDKNEQKFFSLKQRICVSCPLNTVYSVTNRKCQQYVYLTNLPVANNKLIAQDVNELNTYKNINSQANNKGIPVRICPEQAPISFSGKCAQCPPTHPFYIISKKQCGNCDNYNLATNTCPPKPNRYPNLTNFYWITNDGKPDRIITKAYNLRSTATSSMCPQFYNEITKSCIECPVNQYYNYDTNICQQCPPGTIFDMNIHFCATTKPLKTFFTNLQQLKKQEVIYGGKTFAELESIIKQGLQNTTNSVYCPPETPFYDNIQCIRCPEYKKYFNLRYNLCQVCLTGEVYQDFQCRKNGIIVFEKPQATSIYATLFNNDKYTKL